MNPASPAPRFATVAGRALLVLAGLSAATGCSTVRGWFDSDKDDATEPTPLADITPTASLTPAWTVNLGEGEGRLGLRQAPAVADGRVYASSLDGGVRAIDLATGQVLWHRPLALRLGSGPGVGDGLVVVGGLEGEVIALDAQTGEEKWRAGVDNEVTAAPTIGQGRVFVHSNGGRVTALDATTGERRWFWTQEQPALTVRGTGSPTLGPGVLFVGNDDGTVAMLAVNDGRVLWELPIGRPEGRTELERMVDVDGAPVLEGSVLYATSFKGQTVAVDAPSGRPLWLAEHGGPGSVAVTPDRVVVTEPGGAVFGLDKQGGAALWQQPALARRKVTAPAVVGEYAAVADLEGFVHLLRLDTGDFAARVRAGKEAVRAAPVVAGDVVLVQDIDGRLSAFRLAQ